LEVDAKALVLEGGVERDGYVSSSSNPYSHWNERLKIQGGCLLLKNNNLN
jgi:hypothetical protein